MWLAAVVGAIAAFVPAPSEGRRATIKLTKRERDVGHLIAKRSTNSAIADELVLSGRTVDGHVGRLFTKIGVHSRAEVADWMSHDPHSIESL